MAIQFVFTCKPEHDITPVKEQLHRALVGSPAYKESEIAICDGDNPKNEFYLMVGNECEVPSDNCSIGINFDSMPVIEKPEADEVPAEEKEPNTEE